MLPDFGPRISSNQEQPPAEDAGHQLLAEAAASEMAAAHQAEAPGARPEAIQVDEELATAVKGLLERLGGRVRMRQIVYEMHGTSKVDPTTQKVLMEKVKDLGRAGLVVNVDKGVFVSPGTPAALKHARKKAAQRRAKLAKQARIREGIFDDPTTSETRPTERKRKQTADDVEKMIRRELGGSRPQGSRSTARARRRSKV